MSKSKFINDNINTSIVYDLASDFLFTVFYLTGGSTNFVCQKLFTKYNFENSQIEVEKLKQMGYKAMSVKNGHIIGGYCSYSDFETIEQAKEYYKSL